MIPDANGPWLSEQLRAHGVDLAYTVVVGDRPEDLRAALDFLRGRRPDHHQRRPRADRGRSHRAGRRRVARHADGARPRAGGAHLGDREAACAAAWAAQEGPMRAGARKQAHVPAAPPCSSRSVPRPGSSCARRAAGLQSSPGRRASCRRCGRRRSRPSRWPRCWPAARWSAGSCASSRCRSRRSPRRCASSTPIRCRWRSRPACGAASSSWRRSSRLPPQADYDALRGRAARPPRRGAVLRRRARRSTR